MKNSILEGLPSNEHKRIEPFLDLIHLNVGDSLVEPDQPIEFVYFPLDMVASIQAIYAGTTETGMIGYEGCIGVSVWLRQQSTPNRIFVQGAGSAFRMPADIFRQEIGRAGSPWSRLMANYTHSLLLMTSYIAACNYVHPLQARLCRWLMMMQNRIRKQEFTMKQQSLAFTLGVSRPTVSIAANGLQRLGWIRYRRAQLAILDPKSLGGGACGCLRLIESRFQTKRHGITVHGS